MRIIMSNPEVEVTEVEAQEVIVEDTQLSHVFDPAALARSIEAILMVVDESPS
jgi:segregation and condensation protein B